MKKISILVLLIAAQFAFSQTTQQGEQVEPAQPLSEKHIDESQADDSLYTPAEFPGGIAAIRRHIGLEMNSSKFSDTPGTFRSVTTFDINPDGSISSISTTGNSPILNQEMDRIMKKLKKKWIPATKNGQPIKSKYTMPMGLEI